MSHSDATCFATNYNIHKATAMGNANQLISATTTAATMDRKAAYKIYKISILKNVDDNQAENV